MSIVRCSSKEAVIATSSHQEEIQGDQRPLDRGMKGASVNEPALCFPSGMMRVKVPIELHCWTDKIVAWLRTLFVRGARGSERQLGLLKEPFSGTYRLRSGAPAALIQLVV